MKINVTLTKNEFNNIGIITDDIAEIFGERFNVNDVIVEQKSSIGSYKGDVNISNDEVKYNFDITVNPEYMNDCFPIVKRLVKFAKPVADAVKSIVSMLSIAHEDFNKNLKELADKWKDETVFVKEYHISIDDDTIIKAVAVVDKYDNIIQRRIESDKYEYVSVLDMINSNFIKNTKAVATHTVNNDDKLELFITGLLK